MSTTPTTMSKHSVNDGITGGLRAMSTLHSNRSVMSRLASLGIAGALALAAGPAQAGHGSSPQAVASAIASGSPDAIKSELERAEYLVCAACVDYVTPLIDNNDAGVRDVAGWWLVRRGVSRQIFADMLGRLGQPDSVKARNAADVLASFANPNAIPALGVIRRPAAAAPLQAVLGDTDPQVRAAALSALRKVDGFTDGSVATGMLADGDENVRVQAIFTVAQFRTQAATSSLVQVLQSDPSASVRKRAAWALGQMNAPASVAAPALTQASTSDPSPFVRSLARAALASLGQ